MGRTSLVLACVLLASSVTGCAALYGGKPEKLRNPDKKKKPPEPPDQEVKIVYIEDCAADFRGDPTKVSRQGAMSTQLTGEGETALVSGDRAKDSASQAEFYKLGISKLSNALQKDPYNHDATLALALAYDKVNRKGCALALLKRAEDEAKYALRLDEALDFFYAERYDDAELKLGSIPATSFYEGQKQETITWTRHAQAFPSHIQRKADDMIMRRILIGPTPRGSSDEDVTFAVALCRKTLPGPWPCRSRCRRLRAGPSPCVAATKSPTRKPRFISLIIRRNTGCGIGWRP